MRTWAEVEAELAAAPPGAQASYGRDEIGHPGAAGAVAGVGLPRGQLADWRFPPTASCRGLHVHEFAERWVAHLDQVHPACDPVGHLFQDAPIVLLAIGAGAMLGGLLVRHLARSPGIPVARS